MITYGIKTWKYIAFPALFFMFLASFLFAQALRTTVSVRNEMNEHGRVYCMLENKASEEIVLQLSESNIGSVVYEIETKLLYKNVEKTFPVIGIDAKMLSGNFICGTCYTDGSSSLSLVVNRAMISELMDKDSMSMNDFLSWIDQSLIMGNDMAKICGVIDDNSNTPAIYMSTDAAESYSILHGDILQGKAFCVIASDLKSIEAIQEEMTQNGIVTSIDQQKMFDWKMKLIQIKNQVIMGLIALLGFISSIMLTSKMKIEKEKKANKVVVVVRIMMNICVGTIGGLLLNGFVWLWVA